MNELYSIENVSIVIQNSHWQVLGVTRKNKLLHKKRKKLRFIIKRTKDSPSKELTNNSSF